MNSSFRWQSINQAAGRTDPAQCLFYHIMTFLSWSGQGALQCSGAPHPEFPGFLGDDLNHIETRLKGGWKALKITLGGQNDPALLLP